MLEPKYFYRKLDSLLAGIGKEQTGQDFLFNIVTKLESTFGDDLQIRRGRIYEEITGFFELIYPDVDENLLYHKKLNSDIPEVVLVMKTRLYIFDDPSKTTKFSPENRSEYSIPAALVVNNADKKFIFVFDLLSGWVREEVEFCLNAVRRAVNYRLFSEAVISEMQQAARIQQSLLTSVPPAIEGWDIAAKSKPAELVGGDLYDYFRFDIHEFGICFGDASGHGLPAALMVRDVVTGLRMGVEKHMKMVYTLKKLNEVIYRGSYSTSFISLFFAEFENNGNLFYANGGHPAPLLFKKKGLEELHPTGLIFGAFPDISIKRSFAHMDEGDILVLFSDGIVERQNANEEFYGTKEMIKLIKRNKSKKAEDIINIIFQEADKFGGGNKWDDDATLMVIKRIKTK
jgi:sigma-B regulation protein RsbU (phosphoserine phosphatase)